AKHADATRASVSITRQNGAAQIQVRDDGCGGAAMTTGSGLEGLDDRVAATGGTLRLESGPDGTTLTAVIPCA
ncbi:MAG: sensor histidine kinase, partial [Gaiellaceae bacterium]